MCIVYFVSPSSIMQTSTVGSGIVHPSLVVLILRLKCSVGSKMRSSVIETLSCVLGLTPVSTRTIGGANAIKSLGAEGVERSLSCRVYHSQLKIGWRYLRD